MLQITKIQWRCYFYEFACWFHSFWVSVRQINGHCMSYCCPVVGDWLCIIYCSCDGWLNVSYFFHVVDCWLCIIFFFHVVSGWLVISLKDWVSTHKLNWRSCHLPLYINKLVHCHLHFLYCNILYRCGNVVVLLCI